MILSNLIFRHKIPQPRFAPGLFVGLIAFFLIIGSAKPLVALVGLGTVSIVAGVLVEVNRVRIWEEYRKAYRKQKGIRGLLTKPDPIYYTINVALLWPVIILLGALSLWVAYIAA